MLEYVKPGRMENSGDDVTERARRGGASRRGKLQMFLMLCFEARDEKERKKGTDERESDTGVRAVDRTIRGDEAP